MSTMMIGYGLIGLMALSWLLVFGGVRRDAHGGESRSLWERINDLLLCIAGGAPEEMRDARAGELLRYRAQGLVMLVNALLAAIGAGLSVHEFSGNKAAAWTAAVIWAAVVLALEHFTIVMMDKHEAGWRSWLKALPRLAMVGALSYVVSHTIILWMFAADIRRELLKMNQEIANELNRDQRQQQTEHKQRIAQLNEQMKPLDAELSHLNTELAKEVRGEGASKRGDGPVAAALRESIRLAQARKETLLAERAQWEAAVKDIEQQVAANNRAHQDVLNAPAGMLDRARAVRRLTANDPHASRLNLALIIGLLMVETLPVLTKLLARASRYDSRLHAQYEWQVTIGKMRQRIFAAFADGTWRSQDLDLDRNLLNLFQVEFERDLQEELTITKELPTVADKESTLKLYVAQPDTQTDQQQLFVNFGLLKHKVWLAHLVSALTKTAEANDPHRSHWLTRGQFQVLDAQGKPVNGHQPLFAQLKDGVAFIVPAKAVA